MIRFENRLKKELTEGVIRAVFIDAGYNVNHNGIESRFPEINRLSHKEYKELKFKGDEQYAADLAIENDADKTIENIEVKFRTKIAKELFVLIERQTHLAGPMCVAVFWASAPHRPSVKALSNRYLRCFRTRVSSKGFEIQLNCQKNSQLAWEVFNVSKFDVEKFWWRTPTLSQIFPLLKNRSKSGTLNQSISALSGILFDRGSEEHG